MTALALDDDEAEVGELVRLPVRPRTRGECLGAERGCAWIACRHHMAHAMPASFWRQSDEDVAEAILAMPEQCSLAVADRGPSTLKEIGRLLGGLSRERIRQLELAGLARARGRATGHQLEAEDFSHPEGEWQSDHEVHL